MAENETWSRRPLLVEMDRLGPSSSSLFCSMVSFLPLIIFGFTKGNVDFLLQGSFFKIRHLLSNFFATSAPRAQGEGG